MSKKIADYKIEINKAILAFARHDDEGAKIRPIKQSGSGKHARYTSDKSLRIEKYLNSQCMIFKIGNDAPRGGKLGNYIQVCGMVIIGGKKHD